MVENKSSQFQNARCFAFTLYQSGFQTTKKLVKFFTVTLLIIRKSRYGISQYHMNNK